jgi:hypothetical protein
MHCVSVTNTMPLTTTEAAAYLGMSENALKLRRHRGDAPPHHRLASIVVYWPNELDSWAKSRGRVLEAESA